MKSFEDIECTFPETLQEALELQADEKTRGVPLAGGTDLIVQWESGVLPMPDRAMNVKGLLELKQISETDDAVIVGGGATHMQMRRSEALQKYAPSLCAAAATIGGFQMQCQGTIAGSIANASPAGDLSPSLFAFDASVVVASVNGEREIKITEFYKGYRKIDLKPEELIVRFVIPKLKDGEKEFFHKLGPRAAQAISKVMGGYRGALSNGKIERFSLALGSVAPTAVRLWALESWIKGKSLDEDVIAEGEERASNEVDPIADIRSTAEYRKWVSGRLVRGFLEHLSQA